MKTLLFIAVMALTSFTYVTPEDYREGWEDGYCEGWRDVKGINEICPLTPICPIPELNRDTYRDGYNRGFKRGYRDAQRN